MVLAARAGEPKIPAAFPPQAAERPGSERGAARSESPAAPGCRAACRRRNGVSRGAEPIASRGPAPSPPTGGSNRSGRRTGDGRERAARPGDAGFGLASGPGVAAVAEGAIRARVGVTDVARGVAAPASPSRTGLGIRGPSESPRSGVGWGAAGSRAASAPGTAESRSRSPYNLHTRTPFWSASRNAMPAPRQRRRRSAIFRPASSRASSSSEHSACMVSASPAGILSSHTRKRKPTEGGEISPSGTRARSTPPSAARTLLGKEVFARRPCLRRTTRKVRARRQRRPPPTATLTAAQRLSAITSYFEAQAPRKANYDSWPAQPWPNLTRGYSRAGATDRGTTDARATHAHSSAVPAVQLPRHPRPPRTHSRARRTTLASTDTEDPSIRAATSRARSRPSQV